MSSLLWHRLTATVSDTQTLYWHLAIAISICWRNLTFVETESEKALFCTHRRNGKNCVNLCTLVTTVVKVDYHWMWLS